MPDESPHVEIALLGGLSIRVGGRALQADYELCSLLLAWLALSEGRPRRREEIAQLLWPDAPAASGRRRLREILFRLRRGLGDADRLSPVLRSEGDQVAIGEPGGWSCDAVELTRAAEQALNHPHRGEEPCPSCAARLEAALSAYRGDLLAGVRLPEGALAEELSLKRAEARRAAQTALCLLARKAIASGQHDRAVELATRASELDPDDDRSVKLLVTSLARSGRRSEALLTYEAAALRRASGGLSPLDDEAEELYQSLLQEGHAPSKPPKIEGPEPFGALTGRQRELARVEELLASPQARLVTLTGMGGVGKTRLAVEVLRRYGPLFRDGARFVAAAETSSLAELSRALQSTLGIGGASAPMEMLVARLRSREILLVIDNLEQNEGAPELISALLAATKELRIIATSRSRLALRAEHVLPLQGLDRSDAAALLLERTRQIRPDFDAPRETLDALCAATGDLPLGIELTSAQIAEGGEDALRRICSDGLSLAGGFCDLPARQRSLRELFSRSIEILEPSDRGTLASLATFRGAFDAEGALAVAGAPREALQRLLDRSLLAKDGGVYQLHVLVAAFARELDADRVGLAAAHRRYLFGQLSISDRSYWIVRRDDLRAALESAASTRDDDLLASSVRPLLDRLRLLSWAHDAAVWLSRAVDLLADVPETPSYRRCLACAGMACFVAGHREEAEGKLSSALVLAREAGDDLDTAYALRWLAFVIRNGGQPRLSLVMLEEAERLAERSSEGALASRARCDRATALYELGELELAAEILPEAIVGLVQHKEIVSSLNAATVLGLCEILLGESRSGLRRLHESVKELRRLDVVSRFDALNALACGSLIAGRHADAARYGRAAAEGYAEQGFSHGIASSETWRAVALAASRERDLARAATDAAIDAALRCGSDRSTFEAAVALAALRTGAGGLPLPGAGDLPARLLSTVLSQREPITELRAVALSVGPGGAAPLSMEDLRGVLVREHTSVRVERRQAEDL